MFNIRLSTNIEIPEELRVMVALTSWVPGTALAARVRGALCSRTRRLPLSVCIVLAGVGTSVPAFAHTKASLVIETFPAAPLPATVVAPSISRPLDADQAAGSKAVMSAAYALFAQMGTETREGGSEVGHAPKTRRYLTDVAQFAAPSERMECGGVGYRPSGMLGADNEESRRVLYPLIWREACRAGIPAGLLDALIIQESRYRVDAISPRGAIGLTQLMPGTAANLGVNSWAIEDNIRGGARYLRSMLESFGQYHLALAAYNAGPGAVIRAGGVPPFRETQSYVGDIIRRWSALAGN